MVLIRGVCCEDYCRSLYILYNILIEGYSVFFGKATLDEEMQHRVKQGIYLSYALFRLLTLAHIILRRFCFKYQL